jgi:hypothetical protein
MATKIYDTGLIELIDGTFIEIRPLVIKYLREFMETFDLLRSAKNDDESMVILTECTLVCMKQFYPEIKTVDELEDRIDLPNVYKVLDLAAGIKINRDDKEKSVKEQAEDSEGASWDTLDLLKLESEVFMLGIWKNYDEMEKSISMPELLATLNSKRELDYHEKKFLAAIQGVDLEGDKKKEENAWEKMKAKVFSNGATSDPNDILSLQGTGAARAGFGIGMGLSYEKL